MTRTAKLSNNRKTADEWYHDNMTENAADPNISRSHSFVPFALLTARAARRPSSSRPRGRSLEPPRGKVDAFGRQVDPIEPDVGRMRAD